MLLSIAAARLDMIQRQLGPGGPIKAQLSEADLAKIVARTEGYSGCVRCGRRQRYSVAVHGRPGWEALRPPHRHCTGVPWDAAIVSFSSAARSDLPRSDMKNLIQEACQGPLRDACKAHGADVSGLTADALRPVVLRDFQVGLGACGWAAPTGSD